jgi:long-chain acyl-CoA synthetase
LTRTRKVRRGTINTRYGEIIRALFGQADTVALKSLVTYQDGSQVEREISLRIQSTNGSTAPSRQLAGGRR